MSQHISSSLIIALVSASLLLTGCAKEKYQAKPIDPQQTTEKILAKNPLSPDFKVYLIKQGYKESELPFANWGLNELTLSALYHHPKLDVAKAQLALANAQLDSAGLKQNPILSGNIARSDQANEDIRPWAYGLSVDIPIETANKRQIRIEEALHLTESARLDIADMAWQLRAQVAKDLLRYHENKVLQNQLASEVKKQDELIKILEKRLQLGALSNTELNAAKLLQQKTLYSLNSEQAKSAEILAALASDAGLTVEKFSQIPIKPLDTDAALLLQSNLLSTSAMQKLQETALLNRLDIRRSLAKYAAAEAKIKLEVAKQTPDISLSPGYMFEFGDRIWSLGFSTLLNLINKNQTLISEAIQLREIEGAQFEALQAKIIADLSQSLAIYEASMQNVMQVKQQQANQFLYSQKLLRQFDAGLIDRLVLTQNDLNTELLTQQLLTAQFQALQAALAIEGVIQHPLFEDFSMPTDVSIDTNKISINRQD
jgi:cobalt-zinc-cadmium efflux system outer membrane protein